MALGDICEFRYGKALKALDRSGAGFHVYGSNGPVGRHERALTDGATIVIGRKGSYGEVHYTSRSVWPIDTTYYVDASATKCDLRWLAHRLADLGLTRLNRAAAVPGLNREVAYRQRLLLPPLDEQRRIAQLLDATEALRGRRVHALGLVGSLISAEFVSRFGNPVTSPRAWPVQHLGEVGVLDRGVSRHRPRNAPELLGGPYPLIQTGDVARSGGLVTRYSATYSEVGLRQSKLWPAGTLCITIAANIAMTGLLTFAACFPDSVVGFSADPSFTAYVQAWLGFLQPVLERSAPQSAQRNINLEVLRALPVPVPPTQDVEAFAGAVTAVRSVRARVVAELDSLAVLNSGLARRAFAGEL